MKKIFLVGIGTGNPEHLTIQAVNVIKRVNVFFVFEKESEINEDLVRLRKEIVQQYLPDGNYRLRTVRVPERKKGGRDLAAYKERVSGWRKEKAEIMAKRIREDLADGETGALLIWGDPSLYDGHIEILNDILRGGGTDFEYEVIPGITSMQVLASQHKIPLNEIGESVLITTGRRLRECHPADVRNIVVLLDNYLTYRNFGDPDLDIYWGAYLGTGDEVLISGRVTDVLDEIVRTRNEAKKNNGWIMETYIVRARQAHGRTE
jgi:precorrin-6A synthase